MNTKKLTDYILKIVLLTIAIVPIAYFNQIKGVPFKVFILGTGSWGIGLIIKMLLHQFIVIKLQNKGISRLIISFTNGFISGLTELSAAFFVIIFMKEKIAFDFNAIISFGLAIGSLEIFIVVFSKDNELLKGSAIEKHSKKLVEYFRNVRGFKYYIYNFFIPVIERIAATFLHISTRGLIFLTIIMGKIYPSLIALAVFIIADGLLTYYYYITDKISAHKGIISLISYIVVLTFISTTVFLMLSQPFEGFVL